MVGRAFIQLAREGYLDQMSYNQFVDIKPKSQSPPPEPPPTNAPGQ